MSGFDAVRAEATCLRTERHLREIDSLSVAAPHRVGPHVRRLRFVERVLSATVPADALLGDWISAWAVARMTATDAIGSIGIDASSEPAGGDCAALLHVLDALAVALEPADGLTAELEIRVNAGAAGTWIRVSCKGADRPLLHACSALRLASLAGLPAAWREDDDHLCLIVAIDAPARALAT